MFGWGAKTITTDELAVELQQGKRVLIDVRTLEEFRTGHVPSAVNMPLDRLTVSAAKMDPAVTTFVICRSGHRSARAVGMLKRAGFTDARSVKGGTLAWKGKLVR